MKDFIQKLETLRQELPNPFTISKDIDNFYTSPIAAELIESRGETVRNILEYLGNAPIPALVVPSVLLLSYFDPDTFYKKLLNILEKSDRAVAEAFEHGFWRINLEEKQIAGDLINLIYKSGNPNILLLLQRPIVKKFKEHLQKFIEEKKIPLSIYALYCYKYALEKSDADFLKEISRWEINPEMTKLAIDYLKEIKNVL